MKTRWNSCSSVPWMFLLTHCRVDVCVRDWCRVMELLKPVLLNRSSLMNVFEELVTGRPDRCHSSSGEGFPSASQKHTVTSVLLQLGEVEIWGTSNREKDREGFVQHNWKCFLVIFYAVYIAYNHLVEIFSLFLYYSHWMSSITDELWLPCWFWAVQWYRPLCVGSVLLKVRVSPVCSCSNCPSLSLDQV